MQVGRVVRAQVVGTVSAIGPKTVTVISVGGNSVTLPKDTDMGVAYEDLPEPEPAYTAGELYRDAEDGVFQRQATEFPGDRWRVLIHPHFPVGQLVAEETPVRPLRHLVPQP